MAPAGIRTPPASVMPSHASGFRQAATSASSCSGNRLRQPAGRSSALARGAAGSGVFSAESRNA